MKLLFADTGAFYALTDKRDPRHADAAEFYRSNPFPLLTTEYVFAETMSLLTKRIGKRVAVDFGAALRTSPRLRIEDITPDIQEAGWELFSSQADKEYDLIDCISFATMETYRISVAFGFDRHFLQYGFELVPRR